MQNKAIFYNRRRFYCLAVLRTWRSRSSRQAPVAAGRPWCRSTPSIALRTGSLTTGGDFEKKRRLFTLALLDI